MDSCNPFGGASPSDSICDGLDNDCDGSVDEEFITVTTSCGVGVCAGNSGQATCQAGAVVDTCDPLEGASATDALCDGQGVGTDTAQVWAERSGTKKVPGDGRVYHIGFSASDEFGGVCTGTVPVGVPHDKKDTPIDGGPLYDSTSP